MLGQVVLTRIDGDRQVWCYFVRCCSVTCVFCCVNAVEPEDNRLAVASACKL